MPKVLCATHAGCHVFTESGDQSQELPGRNVGPLVHEADGVCLAIVDEKEVWRRTPEGTWSAIAVLDMALQSITSCNGSIFCGAMEVAAILRIPQNGSPERLQSFEKTPGRSEWFAGGPPLGVRSLAKTCDQRTLLAAVHVGGIPRSEDQGATWQPTLPVMSDVHEVSTHPRLPHLVAAAAAVGLCVSHDGGKNWDVLSDGLPITNSLAVAFLLDEALFSIQDGPFAKRSQVWRWRPESKTLEQVRDGLPEWLTGKVDTNQIASGDGRSAIADGGGNLWLSKTGSSGWKQLASGLPYALGLMIL